MNKTINLDDFVLNLYKASETKDISVRVAATNFIEYLKQNNKRPDTIKFYDFQIKMLIDYLESVNINKTAQITNDFFTKYTRYARTVKKYKNTTINKNLTALKYMLRINLKYGYIDTINLDLDKLEDDEERFEIVSDEVMKKLFEIKETYPLKQNVIISILADTGIRRTELVKIKISNISFKDNSIFLEHTKNRKKRFCWVSDETALLIKELAEQCSTEYLIENIHKNDHIEPNAISQIFKKIKKDLNVERLSPHMLRHTFATNLDKQNVDIETMRVLLGHSDYSQLKKYLHKENDKLRFASLTSNIYK